MEKVKGLRANRLTQNDARINLINASNFNALDSIFAPIVPVQPITRRVRALPPKGEVPCGDHFSSV